MRRIADMKPRAYPVGIALVCVTLQCTAQTTSWEKQSTSPTHMHLYAIDFIDADLGWVAGGNAAEGGIWKTTDAGETWETQFYSEIAEHEFDDLDMLNELEGWAAGTGYDSFLDEYGAALHHTVNGGATWNQVSCPQGPTGNAISATRIEFVTPDIGWVGVRPSGAVTSLYRTTNGGSSWTYLRDVALDSWHFLDADTGWAADTNENFIYTTDGGQSWSVAPCQPIGAPVESTVSQVFSAQEVVVTTFESWPVGFKVHHTTDGGQTWGTIQSGAGTRWQFYHDSMTGWGISDGIQKTTDGGMTWTEQRPQNMLAETFRDAHVIDENTVYLVGDYGYFLRTDDGGASWVQQSEGSGREIFGISFYDTNHGWAVGTGNTILHTTDGGDTWTHQFSTIPVFVEPGNVYAYDQDTAMVLYGGEAPTGSAGVIITRDAGETWQNMDPTGSWPNGAVHFPDLQRGFKVSRFGTTFSKTTDGGKTWTTTPTGVGPFPANHAVLDVYFADDMHGWFVGYFNIAYRTTDGGKTWTSMLDVFNQVFRQVRFSDPQHGWIVGNDGFVARSTNGGASWQIQTLPGTLFEHIQEMVMTGPNEMYFTSMHDATARAYVRHTSDGGQSWDYTHDGLFPGLGLGIAVQGSTVWSIGSFGNIHRRSTQCLADFTGDMSLDFSDVAAFLTAFGSMDPSADLLPDSSFDFLDVSVFLAAFGAGCP